MMRTSFRLPVVVLACAMFACAQPTEMSQGHESEESRMALAKKHAAALLIPSGCVSDVGVKVYVDGTADLPFMCDYVDLDVMVAELQEHFLMVGWRPDEGGRLGADARLGVVGTPLFVWETPPGPVWNGVAPTPRQNDGVQRVWNGRWFDDGHQITYRMKSISWFGDDFGASASGYAVMAVSSWRGPELPPATP